MFGIVADTGPDESVLLYVYRLYLLVSIGMTQHTLTKMATHFHNPVLYMHSAFCVNNNNT